MAKEVCHNWKIEPINLSTTYTIKEYEYNLNLKTGQKRKYNIFEEIPFYFN